MRVADFFAFKLRVFGLGVLICGRGRRKRGKRGIGLHSWGAGGKHGPALGKEGKGRKFQQTIKNKKLNWILEI